jgi:predicted small lipoprotein YifL
MRRLVATGLLLLLVIGTAAACGGGGPSAAGPAGTVADPAAPANQFVGIEDVVAAGPTDLTIVTDPLPRAGATGACGPTVVTPRVEEHPTEVLVYVDYAGPVRSPFDRCDVATRTVTVPLAAPVGERTVRDAMGAQFWQRDGAWVGCGHVVMTCITTPASCQNLRDFVANADVPRHFGMGNTRCDGRWAVVDVDIGAGDCPVTGEPRGNPCAGVRVRRMYWQVVDDAWVLVGSDPGPGCGAIAAVAPAFPTSLCADLPVVATGGTGG